MSAKDDKILRTIRNYVTACGGQIPLQTLEEDFETSYGSSIPYERFGYANIIEFLTYIPGIFVKDINGEYQVESLKRKLNLAEPPLNSLQYDNISSLCIEMDNNLLLGCCNSQRKVTVNSEKLSKRTHTKPVVTSYTSHSTGQSEENVYEKCFSPELTIKQCRTSRSVNSLCSNENADSIYENSYYSSSPDLFDCTKNYNEMNSFFPQETVDVDSFTSYDSINPIDLKSEYDNGTYYEEPILDEWLCDRYESKHEISETEVLNRLVNVINSKQRSSTSTEIELRYFDNYSEELPKNWLTLLEKSLLVYIENLSTGIIIYPNRVFLAIPSRSSLPNMQYPDPKMWNVYVTAVTSTTSIWFRLCDDDYDSRYHILTHEMYKHYDGAETGQVTSVKRGDLYAVCMNANVVRVEVIDNYGEMVTCLVIDMGIIRNFNVNCLFVLHEKFMNTCMLALQGSLTGLERYEKYDFINCKLRNLVLNKKATVIVDCFRSEKLVSLNVFIVGPSFNNNINRFLLDEIEQNFSIPKLQFNSMYDVYVLSVGENTTRVHVISKCYNLLQLALDKAKEIIDADEKCNVYTKSIMDIQLNEMYLAKYTDGSWQRIIVQQFLSAYEVAAAFIDFKEVKTVNIRCVVNCSTLPNTLTFIPPQALDVKVIKNDGILNFLKHFYKTNLYSMKVVENKEIPIVEIYLKLPNNANLKPIANILNIINVNDNVAPMYSMW